ncbi:MAG: hypothetical protein GWO24_20105, partial [Akkermansiaceae bacterium]|nr:hypothetical protein [Akkermansiaceae bacterium]
MSERGLVWAGRDGIYISGVDGSNPGKFANAGEGNQSNPAPIAVSMSEAGLFWTVSGRPQLHLLNGSFPFAREVTGQPLG